MSTPDGQLDRQRFKASMERLTEIYRDISATVTEVSTRRCPYKSVEDRCTARFGCRNQHFADGPEELAVCTGSDDLDYRGAWEV